MLLREFSKVRLRSALAAAALAGVTSWLRGRAYLDWRHPHEDAFILFRYAEHLAHGDGIVFNAGGPHAEGATDFLYMAVLALAVRLGADVAVAALWLNALGAALVAAVLALVALPANPRPYERLWPLLLALLVPFVGGAHASYDGFGTELYTGLAALAFYLCLRRNDGAGVGLPYLALVLGLFRPDGVIIGAGAVAVLAWLVRRDRGALRRLARHGAVAATLGLLYFFWRWHYFGELLPLPLYVKSRGGSDVHNFSYLRDWARAGGGPLPLVAALLLFAVPLSRAGDRGTVRALAAMFPFVALAAALGFAYQSQNVDWRFEAPIYTALAVLVLWLGRRARARYRAGWQRALGYGAGMLAFVPALDAGKKVWPLDYMDTFAVDSAPLLHGFTLATTEAGRMSYWNDAVVHDLVGLNDADLAKRPVDGAYLAAARPDLVMVHAAGTLDVDATTVLVDDGAVLRVDPASLAQAVREGFDFDPAAPPRNALPTKVAPVVASRYLASRARDFDVFFVRYGGSYAHLFGVRKTWAHASAFESMLRASTTRPFVAYSEAKRLGACVPCSAARALGLGKVLLWDRWR